MDHFASCPNGVLWLALVLLLFSSTAFGNCTSPVPPPHGILKGESMKESYPVGTVLTYHCMTGYEYIPGIPSITCLNTSKWSEISSLCQEKQCPPPIIENGDTNADNDIHLGSNITFSCVRGYRLVGEATLKCILKDGKVDWNRAFPFCELIPCTRPENIPNGQFDPDPKGEYYIGTVVIYRCNRDFSLIGNSTLTCITTEDGRNGKWDLPAPECKIVKCDPPKVENGILVNLPKPSYTYNEAISFECNSGYSAVGSLHIKCGANSSWVPAVPKCVKVTVSTTIQSEVNRTVGAGITEKPNTTSKDYAGVCRAPILPPHTSLKGGGELADSYAPGTILRLQCIPGYRYLPIPWTNHLMACLDTYEWLQSPRVCERRQCPTVHIMFGDMHQTDGYLLGSQITFVCHYGYRLIGSSTIECVLEFGKVRWNKAVPYCKRILCPAPPEIANGRYSPSDEYEYGLVVTYDCNQDYSLIGKPIYCKVAENGIDGMWNSLPPECKKVKCHEPKIQNGRRRFDYSNTFEYKTTISFECDFGYTMVGDRYVQCDANSEWNPPVPHCVKIMTTTKPTRSSPFALHPNPPEDKTEGSGKTIRITIEKLMLILPLLILIM